MIPWNERVVSFQVNPESATVKDIVRMAEELVEIRDNLDSLKEALKGVVSGIEEWERQE